MKWCSSCKVVYSDDYSICPECDTPLAEEKPSKLPILTGSLAQYFIKTIIVLVLIFVIFFFGNELGTIYLSMQTANNIKQTVAWQEIFDFYEDTFDILSKGEFAKTEGTITANSNLAFTNTFFPYGIYEPIKLPQEEIDALDYIFRNEEMPDAIREVSPQGNSIVFGIADTSSSYRGSISICYGEPYWYYDSESKILEEIRDGYYLYISSYIYSRNTEFGHIALWIIIAVLAILVVVTIMFKPKPKKHNEPDAEENAHIESEIMHSKQETYIARDRSLLWIVALAYFPICYGLSRVFGRIEMMMIDLSFFDLFSITHDFIVPVLFYAIIFALSFAFIRYFFQMDDKPYSYFSKRTILIIAIISVLFKVLAEPIVRQVTGLVYPFYDMNMLLVIISVSLGEVARIVFLAIALVFIWKLTFKMPQHTYKLFKSAYWNACGAIAFAVSLLLIVISALLSNLSWNFNDDFSSYNLFTFVDMLTGGGQIFPGFDRFRDYANLLLCMIPIFYQYKPRNG